ncbi:MULTISPECIES: DUF4292 domain-containing protein [Sphingobacterium]|uniref:DUF4292 domain-containing protein n=1 Tax=Sphingobacterium populi TaxID=1812824 RepID=A0ABW5UD58_9SPHI|nr:DUF4292 domain-containing protein [Sphingobacterium sp. CFCC 11742]
MTTSIVLSSCSSRRQTVKATEVPTADVIADNSIKTFEMSNLDYFTFSGRAKAKVTMDKNSHDATAHIRIDRDKAIWISITALLNIEVARVMITPDSIKIQTKYPKKELITRPFSYVYHYINPGITFKSLQDVLVGNLSTDLLRSSQVQVASSEDDVVIAGVKDNVTFQYGMNAKNRPYATKIEDKQLGQVLDASYDQYGSFDGHVFPQRLILNIEGEGLQVKADLQYNRVIFNQKLEMPF